MSKYILSGVNGNVGSLLKYKLHDFSEYSKHLKIRNEKIFIHIAAKTNGQYPEIIDSNINYLCEILDFCRSNNIKKVIFFSAISIKNKDDLYSISKLFGEKILKNSGLKVLILRLPMILTKDNKDGILNRIVQRLEKDEDIILYNGERKFNNFICMVFPSEMLIFP